jgi:F0F1-type ATP synthase epsilon subunit
MRRIAVLALLVALPSGWLAPARAQSPGVAEYARNSREIDKKNAKQQNRMLKKASKKQQKAMKKYAKAQRKAAKKSYRRGR